MDLSLFSFCNQNHINQPFPSPTKLLNDATTDGRQIQTLKDLIAFTQKRFDAMFLGRMEGKEGLGKMWWKPWVGGKVYWEVWGANEKIATL